MALLNRDIDDGKPANSYASRDFGPEFALIFHEQSEFLPVEIAPVSGIYRCLECGHEIVLTRGEQFPFDSGDGHRVRWQLAVKPQRNPDRHGYSRLR